MPQLARRAAEILVLGVIAFAILWKGGKSLDATWLMTGAAIAATIVFAFGRQPFSAPKWLWAAIMAFIGWTVIAFLNSSTKNYGFDEVLQTTSFGLMVIWAARLRANDDGQFARKAARVIAVAAYVACVAGILVYTLQPISRFVGTFFDHRFHTDYWPNAWAQLCLLAWPMIAWALFSAQATKQTEFSLARKVTNCLVVSFFLGCMFLSYSRGGAIALLGQLFFGLALVVFYRFRHVQWKNLTACVLTVMFLSFGWFSAINLLRSQYYPVESVIRKATFQSAEGNSSASERSQFWSQAIQLSIEKPLLGWGPYSFRFVQPRLQADVLATSDHAHNVFLKFAMERGWPAAALFAIIICFALWSGFRSWVRKISRRGADADLTIAMFVAAAGVLAHNLIDYNLQFVGILLPLAILLGTISASAAVSRSDAPRRWFETILAIALLLIATSEGLYLASSSLGRHAEAKGEYDAAMLHYRSAEEAWFSRDVFLSEANIALAQGQLDFATRALDFYDDKNEQDYRLWKLRGDTYDALGKRSDAILAYRRAYELGRFNDIGISHLLLRSLAGPGMKATPEIDAWRHELELLMNDFALAIEQNAHFISLSRNVEGLIETAKLMATLYPQDAEIYRALIKRVTEKSARDRETYSARPEGVLWK